MWVFGTLSYLIQVKYIKFLALAVLSLYGKFLGLWPWLIHGDNITFKQEAAALQGIFLLPLNLTTGDINHTTVSAFWWGLTSCLVLFWYLSLRNSCRYSDPSVWRGSFVDEVRLLTAMKQYLKRIKRHFPWLDSCRFKLTQVLHLTTESCANALLHVFRRSTKTSPFCLLSNCSADWQNFKSFYQKWVFFLNCSRAERVTWKWDKHPWSVGSDDFYLLRFHWEACQSVTHFKRLWIFQPYLYSPFHTFLKTCRDGNYT